MLFINKDSPAPAKRIATVSERSDLPARRSNSSPALSVTPARFSPSAKINIDRMVITAEREKPEKVSWTVNTPVKPSARAVSSATRSGRRRS